MQLPPLGPQVPAFSQAATSCGFNANIAIIAAAPIRNCRTFVVIVRTPLDTSTQTSSRGGFCESDLWRLFRVVVKYPFAIVFSGPFVAERWRHYIATFRANRGAMSKTSADKGGHDCYLMR